MVFSTQELRVRRVDNSKFCGLRPYRRVKATHMTLPVSVRFWFGESVLLWGVGGCMVAVCVVGIIGAGSGYED